MPKSIAVILFLFSFNVSFAQTETPSTLFTNNYVTFNPAMSGVRYKTEANVLWRNQWTRVNGAPTTLWANYNQKLDKIHGSVGINYDYNVIGHTKSHRVLANYAYHIQTTKLLWSLGISAGAITQKFNSDYFIYPNTPNDPSIQQNYSTAFQANAGFAIHTEHLNAGFSVTQLTNAESYYYTISPVYHIHGDYSFDFGDKWKIIPALHIFADRVRLASTTSIKATFSNKLWFGINSWNLLSSNNSFMTIGPMLGYDFKEKFRVGYSLEFNEFKPTNAQNLTHEVVLSFLLK